MTTTNGSLVVVLPHITRDGSIRLTDRAGRILMVLSRRQVILLLALVDAGDAGVTDEPGTLREAASSPQARRGSVARSLDRMERNRLIVRDGDTIRASSQAHSLLAQFTESGFMKRYRSLHLPGDDGASKRP